VTPIKGQRENDTVFVVNIANNAADWRSLPRLEASKLEILPDVVWHVCIEEGKTERNIDKLWIFPYGVTSANLIVVGKVILGGPALMDLNATRIINAWFTEVDYEMLPLGFLTSIQRLVEMEGSWYASFRERLAAIQDAEAAKIIRTYEVYLSKLQYGEISKDQLDQFYQLNRGILDDYIHKMQSDLPSEAPSDLEELEAKYIEGVISREEYDKMKNKLREMK